MHAEIYYVRTHNRRRKHRGSITQEQHPLHAGTDFFSALSSVPRWTSISVPEEYLNFCSRAS